MAKTVNTAIGSKSTHPSQWSYEQVMEQNKHLEMFIAAIKKAAMDNFIPDAEVGQVVQEALRTVAPNGGFFQLPKEGITVERMADRLAKNYLEQKHNLRIKDETARRKERESRSTPGGPARLKRKVLEAHVEGFLQKLSPLRKTVKGGNVFSEY